MYKKDLRPTIEFDEEGLAKTKEEAFQNDVLRPVIKLQHDLLIQLFKSKVKAINIQLERMNSVEKQQWIQNYIQKEIGLRNLIIGLVVGLFELEELEIYLDHSSNLNKRIIQIVTKRIVGEF